MSVAKLTDFGDNLPKDRSIAEREMNACTTPESPNPSTSGQKVS